MSTRLVSASDWSAAKTLLNTLLTDMNTVHISSTTGKISPSITLESAISLMTKSISSGQQVDADDYSDSDGLVTKYNLLRKYASCRRRLSSGVTENNKTVTASDYVIIHYRDGDFPAETPNYITPPTVAQLIENIVSAKDILEIVTAGVPIHRTGVLLVAPGSEYVYIDECHTDCHSQCHGDCDRGKR